MKKSRSTESQIIMASAASTPPKNTRYANPPLLALTSSELNRIQVLRRESVKSTKRYSEAKPSKLLGST